MAEEKRSDEGRQKLIEVMDQIKAEPNGLAEFAFDPVGYLQRKGISADGLTLNTTPSPHGQVTDEELSMVAGGGCFSLGYYGCYSEGDSTELMME